MTRKQHEIRAKKVKNKPNVIKTKAKRAKGEASTSKRKEKMKRLQSTGHVDDAASLLEDMFKS